MSTTPTNNTSNRNKEMSSPVSTSLQNQQVDANSLNVPMTSANRAVKNQNLGNKQHLNSVRSVESLSGTISRPKLHTMHSFDAHRYPALDNTTGLSKNSKITVEPVSFIVDNNGGSSNVTKWGGSQSDVKSVRSFSEPTSNTKKKAKPKSKTKKQHITPTDVFAKNLSEAVLDVDDSCDSGYVYPTLHKLYPGPSPPMSPFEISVGSFQDDSGSYFSDYNRHKPRRPGLRSAISELPDMGFKNSYRYASFPSKLEKQGQYRGYHYRCSSSESDEENDESLSLLHYPSQRSSYSKKQRRRRQSTCSSLRSMVCYWWLTLLFSISTLVALVIMAVASPLQSVEIISFGNVLGTQKQLMFDLHVRARNTNSWSVQVSHAVISMFAASHYVPTRVQNATYKESTFKHEYLGSIEKLDNPLIFEASSLLYFTSKTSVSTSQIQIKNPGQTKDDLSGNERWSLLIRYPYELTLRGVLRYQLFPFLNTKTYFARVCKVVQVDPATGIVNEAPAPEQSICDEY
ncbi:hypothetical protein EDC96DRAFT_522584 [Choanephora cucurbitarum]|nr:hypothetical protein EDC96DRAFT_522584 [Choanephora cucurbitarum]